MHYCLTLFAWLLVYILTLAVPLAGFIVIAGIAGQAGIIAPIVWPFVHALIFGLIAYKCGMKDCLTKMVNDCKGKKKQATSSALDTSNNLLRAVQSKASKAKQSLSGNRAVYVTPESGLPLKSSIDLQVITPSVDYTQSAASIEEAPLPFTPQPSGVKKKPVIQKLDCAEYVHHFERFLQSTWLYDDRVGRDAQGLSHNTLKVKEVYRIYNDSLAYIFEREKKKMVKELGDVQYTLTDFDHLSHRPVITNGFDPQVFDEDVCDSSINEVYLFHGTKKVHISDIVIDGFKPSRNGLYGGGAIYLTESAEKADQYTDIRTDRQNKNLAMLIVRVLLGWCYIQKPGESVTSQPSRCRCATPDCHDELCQHAQEVMCDSVVAGHGKRFREFLVYKWQRCLPQFFIVYDRF